MSIFFFGDIHGTEEYDKLLSPAFPEGISLSRGDYVIVCGDFGLPFSRREAEGFGAVGERYREVMQQLAELPFTLLFVDGNHENHAFWKAVPVTQQWGGQVQRHPLAENVLHLMRGEYYIIDGLRFWCMGGALSVDRALRRAGETWWPEEEVSPEEEEHGLATLAAHGNEADFIITHAMPISLLPEFGLRPLHNDRTTRYLDRVYARARFRRWYCGHYHIDLYRPALKLCTLYRLHDRI